MKKYLGGNWLRGFYQGEFESIDEAWSFLSNRFLLAYPTTGDRTFYMKVHEKNNYGVMDWSVCKEGVTEKNDLDKDEVLKRCERSMHTGL